ncbi:hypothetical protein LXL04_005781 [Taraxacum kok-saghyz]
MLDALCFMPVGNLFGFPSRNVTCINKCFSPRFNFLLVCQLMFIKCFFVFSFLISHFRWFHIIKYGHNSYLSLLLAFHDMSKFIQAPRRVCIVFGKYDDCDLRFFNSLQKSWVDQFPPVEVLYHPCKCRSHFDQEPSRDDLQNSCGYLLL